MKTWMKWLLGVVVIGIIVACIAAVAFFAIDRLQSPVVSFGIRTGRLWDYERFLPPRDWDSMPHRDLDEMPFYRMPRDRFYSNTFPLRLIGLPLLCLGSLFALGLGAVALIVLTTRKSRGASPPPGIPDQPMPPPPSAPPAAPSSLAACAHCGKPAHLDWSHCPYCGAELVETVSQADESGQEAGS